MKTPKTMIREYEKSRKVGTALRLYTYVRPRKNGEATLEIWGAKNHMRRKGAPVGYKCFFKFRTDSDSYRVRDVLHYTSYSRMMHDHLCYHAPEIGGTDYSYHLDENRGKWLFNRVSETDRAFMPAWCTMLNDFSGTKYRWCAYDVCCGLSAIEYANLYREFPIAEVISKSRNFQLLTREFLGHLASDKAFARYVAKNHHHISLHHMSVSNVETAWKRGKTCEEYMKALLDVRRERERKRVEAMELAERKRLEEEMASMRKWNRKMMALYERIKSICGQYGCYEVIVPKSSDEMYAEAEAMHNCIGRCYTSNHAMGHDVCIFLHKDGKPCVDMRIDPKSMEIKECRFVCNKDAMQDREVMCEAEKVRDNLAKVWKEVA